MSTDRRKALANILAGSAIAVTLAGLLLLVLTVNTPPRGGWGFQRRSRAFPATIKKIKMPTPAAGLEIEPSRVM